MTNANLFHVDTIILLEYECNRESISIYYIVSYMYICTCIYICIYNVYVYITLKILGRTNTDKYEQRNDQYMTISVLIINS